METILSQRMALGWPGWTAPPSAKNCLDISKRRVIFVSVMKLVPAKLKSAKLIPFNKVAPNSVFRLGKNSKAAVIVDKNGVPQLFIFDPFALLDVLSKIDEELVDRLSTEEYHAKSVNPAGWLIDEIESKLPLNPKFVLSLQKSIAEAEKNGFIPFDKVKRDLGLA
jgi:hypothetical protein